jgi:vitamin-K-epoxide reductase (warfarin-sensitive)
MTLTVPGPGPGVQTVYCESTHPELLGLSQMRYILAILAVAGMVVSYLALRVHYSTESTPCSINEKWDCGIVNHSPYAVMHGVPVAALGIAGYFVIALLAIARRRGLLVIATVIGMGFALYLSNIEARVLGVWCVYCVTSQGLIAVLMILSMAWWGASLRTRTST